MGRLRQLLARDERVAAGRVGGALWLLAALATAALTLLPQVDVTRPGLLAATAITAALWGAVATAVVDWRRVPVWVLTATTAIAIVYAAATIMSTGGVHSPARLYTLLILAYAAGFLPVRSAALAITGCVAVHALPVLEHGGAGGALAELAFAAPVFAAVGAVVFGGRRVLERLARDATRTSHEHRALRDLATAVAGGLDVEAVCDRASELAATLAGADSAAILRFDGDVAVVAGMWSERAELYDIRPDRAIEPGTALAELRDGRPVEITVDTRGDEAAALEFTAYAGAPVRVNGRVWGAIFALSSRPQGLPTDTGRQLTEFGGLVAMAIENAELHERLTGQAFTDPLTGLANHRAFQERLHAEIARARRHARPLSLALIDLDHFKAVNDTAGHATGDRVLAELGARLRAGLRREDLLARVGGDEFALLLPETDESAAFGVIERARLDLESEPLVEGLSVTISAGICELGRGADGDSILRLADGALYWSKEHGRNLTWIYDPETVRELSAAERLERLQRSHALAGIRALARAIDAKDPSTSEHSERVAALAARIATARGWDAGRVALLREAALVHDVGKIGVPDAVLLKPGRLDPDEYEQVKQHAALGARIVDDILSAEQVAWIRSHHERPDGRGYPDGLTDITEGAALLAAADCFDVMTVARPYSRAKAPDEALAECRALVGAQFTAAAVAALEAALSASLAPAAPAA